MQTLSNFNILVCYMLHFKNSSLNEKIVQLSLTVYVNIFRLNNWLNLEHRGSQHPLLFILSDFSKDSIKVAGLTDSV